MTLHNDINCIMKTPMALIQQDIANIKNQLTKHEEDFKEFKQELFEKFDTINWKYSWKWVEKAFVWFIIWASSVLISWVAVICTYVLKLYFKNL